MIKTVVKKILKAFGYSNESSVKKNFERITGFKTNSASHSFLLEGVHFLQALKNASARFSQKGDAFILTINSLNFKVNSWEELFILNEVFVEKVYDINFPPTFALIDIGMNVGISSLYFASNPRCKKIYAYEPFALTIEKANDNFIMNTVSNKINVFNYGLGFPTRKETVFYSETLKGSVGIYSNTIANNADDRISQELEIKDVAESLQRDLSDCSEDFVAKIDCEGAEYEIIRRLDETGLLSKFSFFMIEWHGDGANELKRIFLKNNYDIEEKPSEYSYRGMIYCKRKI